jgi:hypothetical protein
VSGLAATRKRLAAISEILECLQPRLLAVDAPEIGSENNDYHYQTAGLAALLV